MHLLMGRIRPFDQKLREDKVVAQPVDIIGGTTKILNIDSIPHKSDESCVGCGLPGRS